MRKIKEFFCYSNITIAISAASFYFFYGDITNSNISIPHIFFIFGATHFTYTAMRVLPNIKSFDLQQSKASLWHKENKKLSLSLTFISLFFIISSATFYFDFYDLALSLVMLLLCLAYYGPINLNLRKVPFFKNILISFVWMLMGLGFYKLPIKELYPIYLEAFLFIFVLCFPFDLQEKELDQKQGLKTLAHLFSSYKKQCLFLNALILLQLFVIEGEIIPRILFFLIINLAIHPRVQKSPGLNFLLVDGLIITRIFF